MKQALAEKPKAAAIGGHFLYQRVIIFVENQIEAGTLRPGDRLPSLRSLSLQMGLSIPTVRQAYLELERRHQIEARPKSGYFVRARSEAALVRKSKIRRASAPVQVQCRALIDEVFDGIHRPDVLPLGIASPTMAYPAHKMLHRALKRVMPYVEERMAAYPPTNGDFGLRRQLAYRYFGLGVEVDPSEIVVTNGAQEALSLALQTVASPGDIIAVESPTFHSLLELIESLGMLALEIETSPLEGVNLDALEVALNNHVVAACMFSSAVNNPLGSLMPETNRQKLVALLEDRKIPLIEDDVFGDLVFEGRRPHPCQYYARRGGVITCSSFSKTLTHGYRIGWILPGRFMQGISKRKRTFSYGTGLLPQLTLSEALSAGDFDRHLRHLVPILQSNAKRMSCAVAREFPGTTRLSRPRGGSVLWIEIPGVDSVALFRKALDEKISLVPGNVFAARNRYRSFFRLSYGLPWTEQLETGIRTLSKVAWSLM